MKISTKLFLSALLFSPMSFASPDIAAGMADIGAGVGEAMSDFGYCISRGFDCSQDLEVRNQKLEEGAHKGAITQEQANAQKEKGNLIVELLKSNTITKEQALILLK